MDELWTNCPKWVDRDSSGILSRWINCIKNFNRDVGVSVDSPTLYVCFLFIFILRPGY